VSTNGKRERRQGCQRLDRTGTVGRQRPRSRTPPVTERTRGDSKSCRSSIRRSVPSGVKHSVPRTSRAEPRLCEAPTLRKGRQRSGNARGAGARSSYGWQKSIGRIARLAHRGIARSRGGEASRALARRKLEAPPDAGHGWREGESVREYTYAIKSSRVFGLRVSARRLRRRRKAFSGYCPFCPYRQGEAGSFGSEVNLRDTIREERVTGSASVDEEIDRACLRVTTRTSEVDAVRSRQHEVREGPRAVRILDAEKASVEWCAGA
jgi:hypothetical protein